MNEPTTDSTKRVPIFDPLGLIESLTDGQYYDPFRRRIRHLIHDKLLGLAKNLEER